MKASNVLSYAIISLVIIFATTLFAAEAPSGKPVQRTTPAVVKPVIVTPAPVKAVKLPSMMKINEADIKNINSALIDSNMETAREEGKNISLESGEISKLLPLLQQSMTVYQNKINECKTRTYTTEDQKKAGCKDDMTIAQCSKYLYSYCVRDDANRALAKTNQILDVIRKMETDTKELYQSVHYINNHLWDLGK